MIRSLKELSLITGAALFVFIVSEVIFLFFTPRSEILQLITLYGAMSITYLLIYDEIGGFKLSALFAIFIRGLAWLSFPELSDDIYRFIWDGAVTLDGANPYIHAPAQYLEEHSYRPFSGLYPLLNSPEYYSVYPPVVQFISAIGALAANDVYMSSLLIKTPLFIAEIGTIWMLPGILTNLKLNPRLSLFYYFNPLIIVDVLANAHFEILTIFLVLFCIRSLQRNEPLKAGAALALAAGTKLLPILFLPFLLKAIPASHRLKFATASIIGFALIMFPMWSLETLTFFMTSVDLYFRHFEFNASVYYLARTIGEWMVGYNPIHIIGPLLGLVTAAAALFLWIRQKANLNSAMDAILILLTVYLFNSTTVHPWYISMVLLFGLLTQRAYPIIWTLVCVVSYSAYRTDIYSEDLWLIALEYAVLIAAMTIPQIKQRLFSSALK